LSETCAVASPSSLLAFALGLLLVMIVPGPDTALITRPPRLKRRRVRAATNSEIAVGQPDLVKGRRWWK
jgi:hypothetical protein